MKQVTSEDKIEPTREKVSREEALRRLKTVPERAERIIAAIKARTRAE